MLTPEQINEIRAKSGLTPLGQQPAAPVSTQNTVGRFDYLKNEESDLSAGIKSDLGKRIQSIKESIKKGITGVGPSNMGEALNIVGQTAGGVIDVTERLTGAAFDKGTTELSKRVSGTPSKLESGINQTGIDLLESTPGKAAIAAVKGGVEMYDKFRETNLDVARAFENIVNIATVLPGIKAAGSIIKGTVRAAGSIIKPATTGVGKALITTGEAVYKSAIPLSKAEAAMVQSYKAKNPLLQRILSGSEGQPRTAGITAMEKNMAGTENMIGIQAKREAKTLWDKTIQPAVAGIKDPYDVEAAFNRILDKIVAEPELSRQTDLLDALEAMEDAYKGSKSMTYETAQSIKSSLDKYIPEKAFKGKPIGSAFKDIQKMFADDVRTNTYNQLKDINIRNDYLDYGNLKNLQEWGQIAMTGARKKGGFGSFISSLYENLTIPAKTIGGQILRTGGKILTK